MNTVRHVPCHGCKERHTRCHVFCEKYVDYRDKQQKSVDKRRKEQEKANFCFSVLRGKHKSNKVFKSPKR